MYRACLFLVCLAFCSALPNDWSGMRPTTFLSRDDSEVVDNAGAGYSYFKKQDIELRPSAKSIIALPSQDMSEYADSSALKPEPSQTRFVQTVLPRTEFIRQPVFTQKDLTQIRTPAFTGYTGRQSDLLTQSTFGSQQQDLKTLSSNQILLPRTTLTAQPSTFSGYSGSQQIRSFPETSQWSGSQSTISKPFVNTEFMSSPPRRVLAKSQPVSTTGGW
ncbi:unnamed protein product [Adineta steineri]|uniref:Uncharacterized protein n=1 Tax=Adineta steineri TaxID=433720 RepID=A0A814TPZ7_9BILA|nr:unnamed protein product [Adineta steineri]CAF3500483.1 unnamed protein product [Adineta steineri]